MYLIMLNLYPFLLPFNLSDYLSELYPDVAIGLLKVQAYITKNYLPVSHVPFFKKFTQLIASKINYPILLVPYTLFLAAAHVSSSILSSR